MLIISRLLTLQGASRDALAAASNIHGAANDALDVDLSLFAGVAGYPANTFIFSAVVESFAQGMAQNINLLASDAYHEAGQALAAHNPGVVEQRLRAIVGMAPTEPPDSPVGSLFSMLVGEVRPDKMADSREFGLEAMTYVHEQGGRPIAFVANVSGNLSEVGWLVLHESPADFDEMMAWTQSDAGYQALSARAAEIFMPGSVNRTVMAKLA